MLKSNSIQTAQQVYRELAPSDQKIVNAILELAVVLLKNMQQVQPERKENES